MKSKESNSIEDDVRGLISEVLELEPREIKGDAHFVKELGMDSMMALEIMAGIEKKYRIVIPEDALPKFTDLNATVSIVQNIIQKRNK